MHQTTCNDGGTIWRACCSTASQCMCFRHVTNDEFHRVCVRPLLMFARYCSCATNIVAESAKCFEPETVPARLNSSDRNESHRQETIPAFRRYPCLLRYMTINFTSERITALKSSFLLSTTVSGRTEDAHGFPPRRLRSQVPAVQPWYLPPVSDERKERRYHVSIL